MEEEESQLARNLAKVKGANTKLTQKITQLTKTNPKDQQQPNKRQKGTVTIQDLRKNKGAAAAADGEDNQRQRPKSTVARKRGQPSHTEGDS